MAENFGTYPDDTDKYLAQPALLTRSLSPWSLSSPSGADHSYDTSSSLSNEALTGNGTDRALGPPALEDILFNESMLRADNVIPQSNQAVSRRTILRVRRSSKKHEIRSQMPFPERPWSCRCLGLTTHGFGAWMSQCSQIYCLQWKCHQGHSQRVNYKIILRRIETRDPVGILLITTNSQSAIPVTLWKICSQTIRGR